ncbi:hypothetical protein CGZ97_13470 [Enemella evansiae]|nr:hypothetical protein CGZ97_13470 [Enemella evansiae]
MLTAVLIASLVGFTLLPTTPAPAGAGAGQQAGRAGGGASPDASPSPTPSPTPTIPPDVDPRDAALYRIEVNTVACPAFKRRSGTIPEAELRTYLEQTVDCLTAANRDAFERAGIPLPRPSLEPESSVASSPCSSGQEQAPDDWAALYCGTNQTIYYHPQWNPDDAPYLPVMAHEFGHHMQMQTGILDSSADQQRAARTQPNGQIKALEISRRVELQAQCIAGATINGDWSPLKVPTADYQDFILGYSTATPENAATHGTGRANTRWITSGGTGKEATRYKPCNTFIAPADQVE